MPSSWRIRAAEASDPGRSALTAGKIAVKSSSPVAQQKSSGRQGIWALSHRPIDALQPHLSQTPLAAPGFSQRQKSTTLTGAQRCNLLI
jgi:hypothetical protein